MSYIEESDSDGYSGSDDATLMLSNGGLNSQRRGNLAFIKVEQEGLSETLQVPASYGKPFAGVYSLHGNPKRAAWSQPKIDLTEDGANCELLKVYALQHALGSDSFDKVTLTCPGGPSTPDSESALIQLRWLHVQRQALTLELLKDLVLACPYISRDLGAVAARLLDEIHLKYAKTSDSGAYLEPGSIMRYLSRPLDTDEQAEHQGTEPALFISCPQLAMKDAIASSTEKSPQYNYRPRTLLQTLYNYDTKGDEREQIVQKVAKSKSGQMLYVNELWCLLIGSNILITMSDLSAKDIQGKAVTIDEGPGGNGGFMTIQLFENGKQHNSVINAACTYVDLAKHCVLLATGDASYVLDYDIMDEDKQVLTPERWLELLSSTDSYNFKLYIKRKKTYRQTYRANGYHEAQYGAGSRRYSDLYDRSQRPTSGYVVPYLGSSLKRPADSSRQRDEIWRRPRIETHRVRRKEEPHKNVTVTRWTMPRRRGTGASTDRGVPSEERKVRFESQSSDNAEVFINPRVNFVDEEGKIRTSVDREESPRSGLPAGTFKAVEAEKSPNVNEPRVSQLERASSSSGRKILIDRSGDEKDSDADSKAEPDTESALVLYRPGRYRDGHNNRSQSSLGGESRVEPEPSMDRETALVLYRPRHYLKDEYTRPGSEGHSRSQNGPRPDMGSGLVIYNQKHYTENYDKGTRGYRDNRFRSDTETAESPNTSVGGQGTDIAVNEPCNKDASLETQDQVNQLQGKPNPDGTIDVGYTLKTLDELRPIILSVEPRSSPRQVTFSENTERALVPWKPLQANRERSGSSVLRTYGNVVIDPDLRKQHKKPKVYQLEDAPKRITTAHPDSLDVNMEDESSVIGFPETAQAESDDLWEGFSDDTLADRSAVVPFHPYVDEGRQERGARASMSSTLGPHQHLRGSYMTDKRIGSRMQDSAYRNEHRPGLAYARPEKVRGSDEASARRRPRPSWRRQGSYERPSPAPKGKAVSPPNAQNISTAPRVESSMSDVICFPFLSWKLQGETSVQDNISLETKLSRIMTSVEQTLLQSELKNICSKSFHCTIQDLKHRHTHLARPFEDRPFTSLQDFKDTAQELSSLRWLGGGPTLPGQLAGEGTEDMPDKTAPPASDSLQPDIQDFPTLIEQKTARPVIYDSNTMKILFRVSQDIFQAFMPDSIIGLNHTLSKQFWGALDDIYRQMDWESGGSDIYNHLFTIANFDAIQDTKPRSDPGETWQDCKDCQSRRTYMSVPAALNHLHTHMTCLCTQATRPYEDPCYSWVECVPDYRLNEPRSQTFVLKTVDRFIEDVSLIRDQIKELHALVANAGKKGTKSRPPLVTNLVDALTEILKLYILQAKALSCTNRIYHDSRLQDERDIYRSRLKRVQERQQDARIRALHLLRDAKIDIILLGTTGQGNASLAIESVGAEFLLISLISSMQNREAVPADFNTSNERQDSSYIDIYYWYGLNLSYQASKRPKRKVFKEIHHFQEELAAVNTINKAQHTLLDRLVRLLDPQSFRITNKTRIGRFRAEKALAQKQQRRIKARTKNIQDLIHKMTHLKSTIKQMIEIIDEDHGKAIRVFTIVTLFFLPLSFVSSFMGMNTTDVRDMNYSQAVFWATAMPVTVMTVAVALLYGYYGDDIGDWVHNNGWLGKRRHAFSFPIQGNREVRKQQTADSLGF